MSELLYIYLHIATFRNSQILQPSCHKSYHLVITDLVYSYQIESTNQQSLKLAPPFLSTSLCAFILGHMPYTNHLLQLKPAITKVLVPSLCREYSYSLKFTEIHPAVSLMAPYKVLPFNEIIIKHAAFFSSISILSFHSTLFVGICVDPTINTHFIYTLLSDNSLISSWISIKFAAGIFLCMLYL